MKKAYRKPEMKVCEMITENIMTLSKVEFRGSNEAYPDVPTEVESKAIEPTGLWVDLW